MSRRYRNRQEFPFWKWFYFGLFAIICVWLLLSLFKSQNPADVVKSTWSTITGSEKSFPTTKQLQKVIDDKDNKIATLQKELDELKSSLHSIATVNVDSPTLNLRSEASLNSEILFKIPNGSAVEVLYYDTRKLFLRGQQGQWARIKYADKEGWVWGNFLDLKH